MSAQTLEVPEPPEHSRGCGCDECFHGEECACDRCAEAAADAALAAEGE